MTQDASQYQVYLEVGSKRTFAVALDWPGWSRSARDESAALQALFEVAPRYAHVLNAGQVSFIPPSDMSALVVVEREAGDATTDFGAPSLVLSRDAQPVRPAELEEWQGVLKACWQAFDTAARAAAGKSLSTGPRGGGRELEKIIQHVRDVDAAYLNKLGGKLPPVGEDTPQQALAHLRQAILATLTAAAHGEVPAFGPRGGARWPPRYFVRRLAWHELDHTWEIEDRAA